MTSNFWMNYQAPDLNLMAKPKQLDARSVRRYRFSFTLKRIRDQLYEANIKLQLMGQLFMTDYQVLEIMLDECYRLTDLSSAYEFDTWIVKDIEGDRLYFQFYLAD